MGSKLKLAINALIIMWFSLKTAIWNLQSLYQILLQNVVLLLPIAGAHKKLNLLRIGNDLINDEC